MGSVSSVIRSRLLADSRPIFPLMWPKVIWNGAFGGSNTLLTNSTAESGLQLVQGMQNATLVSGKASVTEGEALVA